MPFCRETSLTATGISGGGAVPVKCRSWTCPTCREDRRRRLLAQAFQGKPNRFVTITCRRGQYETPNLAAKAISEAWRTAVRRWRRLKQTNKCEYLCVFEAHKSGWPHLHILWRGEWLDQKWLSTQMASILNSPGVDVRYLSPGSRRAAYVTKYCGKASHKFGTQKRYWMTPGYVLCKPTDVPRDFPKWWKWERDKRSLSQINTEWSQQGREPYELARGAIAYGHLYFDLLLKDRPPKRLNRERDRDKEHSRDRRHRRRARLQR